MKVTIKQNNQIKTVTVKCDKAERLMLRELEMFRQCNISGTLSVTSVKPDRLIYTDSFSMSINDYLKKYAVDKQLFYYFVKQITDTVDEINRWRINFACLMLDLKYIYIELSTAEIKMMFLPIEHTGMSTNPEALLMELIRQAKTVDKSTYDSLALFFNYLCSLRSYDKKMIDDFIGREAPGVMSKKTKRCGNSGFITNKPREYFEHYVGQNETSNQMPVCTRYDDGGLDRDGAMPTSLLAENVGASVLNANPQLTRLSTMETAVINKPVFRIGKERSCVDFCITENTAISRSHADFIIKNGRCYIVDLSSTNGTFLDDGSGYNRAIQPGNEVEVMDGNKITMADEVFLFSWKK